MLFLLFKQNLSSCDEYRLMFISDCGFREIRLAGWGNSSTQGRVEVCNYNLWGSVCDDTWDVLDAKVACYQLGYSTIGIKFIAYTYQCKFLTMQHLQE